MFKITERSASISSGECPFTDRCSAGESWCQQTLIIADGEYYKKAKALGLHPDLTDERWLTNNFNSDKKLTDISICPNIASDPVAVEGLGKFLKEVSPDTLVEDADQWSTLREVEGVIEGTMDIDEVTTEAGFSLLDRITGGEAINRYAVDYRISILNGVVERVSIFNLEESTGEQ